MNLLAQPFRQFKLIIIFATALAAIYVFFYEFSALTALTFILDTYGLFRQHY